MRRLFIAGAMLLALLGPASSAQKFTDIACETSSTSGTGTLNLGGAVSGGYLGFLAAGIASGDSVPYTLVNGSGAGRKLETGWGTFTDAAPDTLTRVADWSTDGAGAELTLSGNSTVCVGPIASLWADKFFFANGKGINDQAGARRIAIGTASVDAIDGWADTVNIDLGTNSFPALAINAVQSGKFGPTITSFVDTSSPAVNDVPFAFWVYSRDSAANLQNIAQIQVNYDDVTSGTEDASWGFYAVANGVIQDEFYIGNGALLAGASVFPGKGNLGFTNNRGIFDGQGNEQLLFTQTASAVNELTLANAATGGNPTLSATGGDSAIGITLKPKGGASLLVDLGAFDYPDITVKNSNAGQGPGISLYNAANSASGDAFPAFVNFKGNDDGGNATTYSQIGSFVLDSTDGSEDAYIGIRSQVAGSSAIRLTVGNGVMIGESTGTLPGLGNLAIANGKSIVDFSANEYLKFSSTASAVNEVTLANAATGNRPIFSATGGDSDIGMEFDAKGTPSLPFRFDVGDNTTSAVAELYSNADAAFGPILRLRHDDPSADAADSMQIVFQSNDSAGNATNMAFIDYFEDDPTDTSEDGRLTFRTRVNGSLGNRMSIADGVVIGTGTTFPGAGNLQLTGQLLGGTSFLGTFIGAGGTGNGFTPNWQMNAASIGATSTAQSRWSNSATQGTFHIFAKSRGTSVGDYTTMQSGDLIGGTFWNGSDGTDFETAAAILAYVDGTPGHGTPADMPGRIQFMTTPDGADDPVLRATVKNDGGVIIGDGTSSPGRGTLGIADSAPGSAAGGEIRFYEDTDTGADYIAIRAPGSITTTFTCVLENDANPIPDSCVGNGTDDTGGGGVTDGDKGDITVSSSGAQWDVDADLAISAALPAITITGTDSGAVGPTLTFFHDSATPAFADFPMAIIVKGGASDNEIGRLTYKLLDGTGASEDGFWGFEADINGANDLRLQIGDGVIVGNGTVFPGAGSIMANTYEVGNGSTDTTITRTGAGAIAVEGVGVSLNTTSQTHTASQYEVGNASDTTLARSAAGDLSVESKAIKRAGKQMMWIPASAMIAKVLNGAACGDTYDSGSNDVTIRVCNFDTTTQEFAHFQVAMPKSWNESTVTFAPVWTNTGGASTQTVVFGLACVAISNDDTLNAAMGTAQTSTDTWLAQNDEHEGPESSAITCAGTPAENDYVAFEINRTVASDNMAGDAALIGIKLYWTDNASTLAE